MLDETFTWRGNEVRWSRRGAVTIMWGTEDAPDRAERLASLIPGAELHLVPNAGHLIQLDAPEALTGLFHRWLLSRAS